MASKNDIDALVELLDKQMSKGSKHVNIHVPDPKDMNQQSTTIQSGMDCDSGDTACKIPNLTAGLDNE